MHKLEKMLSNAPHAILLFMLLVGTFLFPYHAYPLITFHVEWFTMLVGLLFVGYTLLFDQWDSTGQIPRAVLPLGLFALLLCGHAAVAAPYYEGPTLAALYVSAAALVWWGSSTAWVAESMVLPIIAGGGFLMSIAGFMQHYDIVVMGGALRAHEQAGMLGTLGQRSMFATYVACGLVALISMRRNMPLVELVAAVMGAALALSEARVAYVYMLIALAAAFAHRDIRRTAVWLVAVMVFAAVASWAPQEVVRATSAAGSAGEALGGRWALIVQAWRVWTDGSLVFGHGWGSFRWESIMHALPGDYKLPDRHAHNIVMMLLAEVGVLGLGLVGWAFWLGAREAWKQLSAGLKDPHWPYEEGMGIIWVLCVIGAFSFTEFPLWHGQFLLMTAVLMGQLPQAYYFPYRNAQVRRMVGLLLMAWVVLLWVIWGDYKDLESFVRRAEVSVNINRSAFRPEFEFFVTATMNPAEMVPSAMPALAALQARVLRAYPAPEIICYHIETLQVVGDIEYARQVKARALLHFPAGLPCR